MPMGIHSAEARIDLGQLHRNIQAVRARLGETRLLFPVKADGYGHGAVAVSRAAEEAEVDYLGVANLGEALELRRAGIRRPILILSACRPEVAPELAAAAVTVSLSTVELAQALERAATRAGRRVRAHVKVDTGMGRNGVLADEAVPFVRFLHERCPHLELEGIFSHFSVSYSEEPDDRAYTQGQIRAFNQVLAQLDGEQLLPSLRHIANSSGLIQHEGEVTGGYYNMVRPGILLYGYPEVRRPWTGAISPVLSLVTWVVSLKTRPPGRYVGYGRRYRTDSRRVIATLPVGYGDGINPSLGDRGEVLVHGERAPIVGGVSMDQTTADVTHIPQVKVGDEVTLIGDALPADELALKVGAPFTEVVLTALSRRVARVYV